MKKNVLDLTKLIKGQSSHYICPYCRLSSTVRNDSESVVIDSNCINQEHWAWESQRNDEYGDDSIARFYVIKIKCPSSSCNKCSLHLLGEHRVAPDESGASGNYKGVYSKMIMPSAATPLYHQSVPKEVYQLYKEACLVQLVSPVATAVLARTCLDRMIRDYWRERIPVENKENEIENFEKLKALFDDEYSKISDITRELHKGKLISTRQNSRIKSFLDVANSAAHWKANSEQLFWDEKSFDQVGLLTEIISSLFKEWYIRDYEEEEQDRELDEWNDNSKTTQDSKGGAKQ